MFWCPTYGGTYYGDGGGDGNWNPPYIPQGGYFRTCINKAPGQLGTYYQIIMTIVFDIFPSHGHQHASYKLAKILKDCGHKIYYIGQYRYFQNLPPGFSRRYVNPHIFSFVEIHTKSKWTNMKIAYKEKRKHNMNAFNQNTRQKYDELMDKLKPDVILVDYHYVQKAVLYYKYRVPVISVQTTLASEISWLVPPFCSSHIPNQSLLSRFVIFYLWFYHILKKRIRFWVYKILFLGENHLSDVKRLSKQTGYPLKKNIDYKQYKGYGEFGLKNIPQFLLSPRDFDFPHPLAKNQYAIVSWHWQPRLYRKRNRSADGSENSGCSNQSFLS